MLLFFVYLHGGSNTARSFEGTLIFSNLWYKLINKVLMHTQDHYDGTDLVPGGKQLPRWHRQWPQVVVRLWGHSPFVPYRRIVSDFITNRIVTFTGPQTIWCCDYDNGRLFRIIPFVANRFFPESHRGWSKGHRLRFPIVKIQTVDPRRRKPRRRNERKVRPTAIILRVHAYLRRTWELRRPRRWMWYSDLSNELNLAQLNCVLRSRDTINRPCKR